MICSWLCSRYLSEFQLYYLKLSFVTWQVTTWTLATLLTDCYVTWELGGSPLLSAAVSDWAEFVGAATFGGSFPANHPLAWNWIRLFCGTRTNMSPRSDSSACIGFRAGTPPLDGNLQVSNGVLSSRVASIKFKLQNRRRAGVESAKPRLAALRFSR